MPFPTFSQAHKEPILCWLYGVAKGGKSTLALDYIRENQPGVVIPMDQRFEIYRDLALVEGVQVWPVSDPADPSVWASADHISEHLRRNFPGSGAKSLVWDSVTPGFRHWVEWAQGYADMTPEERAKILGAKYKNKSALYQPKAHYMEQVALIAHYGVNCLWISHEHAGRDERGQETVKTSVTDQERLKFQRNVNLTLKVILDKGRYGVVIEEARNRPELNGKTFWDEPGNLFRGMWRKIADAFYAAEVVNWERLDVFATDEQAAQLATEQTVELNGEIIGAFKNVHHAMNAFKQVKESVAVETARPEFKAPFNGNRDAWILACRQELAKAWKAEVAKRLNAAAEDYLGGLEDQPAEDQIPF